MRSYGGLADSKYVQDASKPLRYASFTLLLPRHSLEAHLHHEGKERCTGIRELYLLGLQLPLELLMEIWCLKYTSFAYKVENNSSSDVLGERA